MTKANFGRKLLAIPFFFAAAVLAVIMAVCVPTSAVTARAEEDMPLLVLQEVDLMSTVGYKIEKKSGVKVINGESHPYDYILNKK